MSEQRVFVSINVGDLQWELITSNSQITNFVDSWKQVDGEKVLEIKGVLDHRDANEIELYIVKELITGVCVQLIKM